MEKKGLDPSERLVSVAQLLGHLQADPAGAKEFARDPSAFLERRGYPLGTFEIGHGEEALAKARKALDAAALNADESLATALPKLSRAAEEAFGEDYGVEVEPFAIRFLERPTVAGLGFRWTVTGYIRCTWDGWDGCSIGLDW